MSDLDWDDAFTNGAYITGADGFPPRWVEAAAAFRASTQGRLDIAYGSQPRARYDLFLPDEGRPQGLVVFVHGGYWLKFDKSCWSHLAAGSLARGWAVAMPSYTLAPEARIPDMTREIAAAITHGSAAVDGPIRLAGHSAGGHLVTRMICDDGPLMPDVIARIAHVVSISGLHDPRPLLATAMNGSLGLSAESAAQESPALHAPWPGIPVTTWVGGHERPEFLRQSALLRESWAGQGARIDLTVAATCHHFNVIDGLCDPDSPLTDCLFSV